MILVLFLKQHFFIAIIQEMEELSPLFKGKAGNAFAGIHWNGAHKADYYPGEGNNQKSLAGIHCDFEFAGWNVYSGHKNKTCKHWNYKGKINRAKQLGRKQ